MNWQDLINWQIGSFGGNPAIMVEVTNGSMDSVHYTASEVVRRGLTDSIKTDHCRHSDVVAFADKYKPGAVSFAFIQEPDSYEAMMKALRAIYELVHFNSLMAGSGADNFGVKQALDDFCKEKQVPWRVFSPGVWAIHHCHRPGQAMK